MQGLRLGRLSREGKGMATHSRILAWRIPMDRGAWSDRVHGVAKSGTRLKWLSVHTLWSLSFSPLLFHFLWGYNWKKENQGENVFVVPRTGEGNGTPLQYSCLESPMDGGAWWTAVHGSWRVGHDWVTSLSLFIFMHWRRKWQPTPVFLPGESQGRWSLVGCRLWGRTESDTTEAT